MLKMQMLCQIINSINIFLFYPVKKNPHRSWIHTYKMHIKYYFIRKIWVWWIFSKIGRQKLFFFFLPCLLAFFFCCSADWLILPYTVLLWSKLPPRIWSTSTYLREKRFFWTKKILRNVSLWTCTMDPPVKFWHFPK